MASVTPNMTPAVDQTYGQRSVFGGDGLATAPMDADLDCEDEQEALAYLRLVRDEANKIPHVMVMPRHGPQALPPGFEAAAAAASSAAEKNSPQQKRRRRRRRHWDEQQEGTHADLSYAVDATTDATGSAAKKRRVSRQQAVTVGLSYDDEVPPEPESLAYEVEVAEGEGSEDGEGEEGEVEASDNGSDDGAGENDERDYTLEHRDLYESSVGDARGYYHDGAYVAAPREEDMGGSSAADIHGRHGQISTGHCDADGGTAELDADDPDADPDAESARFSAAYRSRLLLTHFVQLRAIVRPSPEHTDLDQLNAAVTALPRDHDTDVGPLSTRSSVYRRWTHLLRTTEPLPAQIAAMDKVSVLRLLRILLRGLLAGGSSSSRSSRAGRFEQTLVGGGGGGLDMTGRTSRWLWSLFARLPDRGELDYREVGYIRDVAKQAVMRLAHLSYDMAGTNVPGGGDEEEGEEEEEEYEENEHEGGEGAADNGDEGGADAPKGQEDRDDIPMDMEPEPDTGEVEEAGPNAVASVDETKFGVADAQDAEEEDNDGEMQQRATLEMVLAVAGEFYGQRDLLAFRTPWPTAPSA
ncbi:hypothetical protein HMPREF1624_03364 [Sporothrix schenckii ATCC 58251]|uniref:Uncharacterized protein n=1 Tax=Sporothrix schenckii (strain ATCC 58251 / de Perez 2211183) TaxID=1391915 RepID=U7PZ47_SPOS1|nr:hypothetical protein HMPREF1624_03364 [Sporothrix schenckii ATCC 58251]